ncbi:hypothetical protein OCF65_11795 [Bacillus toyonensis]|uniref:hypothetical protein n=1 Tax=Bacillus toyonensis TaxID=155322 RepID=UPI0021CE9955|nr:hypothetical protein [Bacillus toyonensis]MCU5581168.1 hypothetical protein [Bacillus toyonensis]
MSSKNRCYVPWLPCAFPPIPETSVLRSAFRAFNATTTQNVGSADLTQIVYPNKVFDLNNEYDPITSTFTPKQDGIYLIIASLSFSPNVPSNYSLRMFIDINRERAAAADNDFFGEEVTVTSNLLSVSTITQLSKNDNVQILAQATADGITVPGQSFIHFESAKLLS